MKVVTSCIPRTWEQHDAVVFVENRIDRAKEPVLVYKAGFFLQQKTLGISIVLAVTIVILGVKWANSHHRFPSWDGSCREHRSSATPWRTSLHRSKSPHPAQASARHVRGPNNPHHKTEAQAQRATQKRQERWKPHQVCVCSGFHVFFFLVLHLRVCTQARCPTKNTQFSLSFSGIPSVSRGQPASQLVDGSEEFLQKQAAEIAIAVAGTCSCRYPMATCLCIHIRVYMHMWVYACIYLYVCTHAGPYPCTYIPM